MQLNGKPGDERGIIHRRFIGAARGFVTGGPLGAAAGFAAGGGGGGGGTALPLRIPAFVTGTPLAFIQQNIDRFSWEQIAAALGINIGRVKQIAQEGVAGGSGVCQPPMIWNGEFCETPGSPAGGVGEAVLGRYGAALEPMFHTVNKMVCLPGMVLGKPEASGLSFCYNKGAISNKERLWPKGRSPLLTGGEMAAIAKAASAAKKFQRTGARFKALGLIKTPAPRKQKALPATRTVKVLESGPGSVQL